jgi:hypothetical protein
MAAKAKTVTKVVGEELTVELTDYQLGRIINGCSSLFNDSSLVAVGVAHAALKNLRGSPGDKFTKSKHPPEGQKKILFSGPTEPLVLKKLRVVIFKQPTGDYLHCLYTDEHIVFVHPSGRCLSVYRIQLIEPNGKLETTKESTPA